MIFIIAGVVISLALTLLIIKSIRRIYKPARPRIKKTFVVQKKVSQTPLTSRPMSTEQCEITIENCCNMNICDTVSFIFIKLWCADCGFHDNVCFLSHCSRVSIQNYYNRIFLAKARRKIRKFLSIIWMKIYIKFVCPIVYVNLFGWKLKKFVIQFCGSFILLFCSLWGRGYKFRLEIAR